ncbi:hypothetical protein L6164_010767 [Bauhinia variegata]|uniref:Uncharacterized protein n=1 Tax=Bauhinia variegata TaxID=167791 RepID=A0ACB9P4A7_BAUVA|nr:hypothetical protein L6164_010767 [Bauhinia variegata]
MIISVCLDSSGLQLFAFAWTRVDACSDASVAPVPQEQISTSNLRVDRRIVGEPPTRTSSTDRNFRRFLSFSLSSRRRCSVIAVEQILPTPMVVCNAALGVLGFPEIDLFFYCFFIF